MREGERDQVEYT